LQQHFGGILFELGNNSKNTMNEVHENSTCLYPKKGKGEGTKDRENST